MNVLRWVMVVLVGLTVGCISGPPEDEPDDAGPEDPIDLYGLRTGSLTLFSNVGLASLVTTTGAAACGTSTDPNASPVGNARQLFLALDINTLDRKCTGQSTPANEKHCSLTGGDLQGCFVAREWSDSGDIEREVRATAGSVSASSLANDEGCILDIDIGLEDGSGVKGAIILETPSGTNQYCNDI